jgi:glyoxylase-like metal-dependent hydrolase (beta-lactamase superfamily II)
MQQAAPRLGGRRKWFIGGLTLLVLLATAVVARYRWHPAGEGPGTDSSRASLLEPYPIQVVPGIYLLGGLKPAAAYAIETSEGLVLVDSGLEPDARSLKQQLTSLRLDWKRLRAILLTHVHADHSEGAESLRQATGAKVYAGQQDAAVLRAGGPREAFFSAFYMPEASVHPTTVDVEVKGDEVFEIGGARFQVLATPGHTPGSICYLMERNGLRALFSGDVVISLVGDPQSTARLSRPLGTYAAYLPPRYRGDARAFLSTLQKLRALPVPDLVLPGHPRMDPSPQSPALSQERWEALLDAGIRDMRVLVERYDRDGASFLDGTPRKLLPGLYYLGDLQGLAVYCFLARSKLFVVNAPGGPGLGEFLNSRLRKLGVQPLAPTAVLLTSCGPEATAGLKDLVAQGDVQVVAAPAGVEAIKKLCPSRTVVLSAEDLPKMGWFEVKPMPLRGHGQAPVAYLVPWGGKTVLFSGPIPVLPDGTAASRLLSDFRELKADPLDHADSLDVLGRVKPDLWLPANPEDGQNANMYDSEWADLIRSNRELTP